MARTGGRRRRRGRVRRALPAAQAARAGPDAAGVRGRPTASAAPGTGTATPAPAATSRACRTPTRSPPSSSRSGPGPRSTRPSRRSCATSSTSPTGSTCAATSRSAPGSQSAIWDDAAAPLDASRPTTARPSTAQFVIMATGLPVDVEGARDPGRRAVPRADLPHRALAARGRRLHRPAGRRDRHRAARASSRSRSSPSRPRETTVFQRTPNFSMPAGNRPLSEAEIADMKAATASGGRPQRTSGFGVPVELPTQSALEVSEDERTARYQAGLGAGQPGRDPRPPTPTRSSTRRPTTPRPSSSATRSGRSSTTRTWPRRCRRARFPFGTKRPCLDTGYYATFNKDNVDAGRPAQDPAGRAHRGRRAHVRAGVRVRRDRVRHRLRRDDRRAERDRHPRAATGSRCGRSGPRDRAPTWGSPSPASRTCSRSPARPARRCCRT